MNEPTASGSGGWVRDVQAQAWRCRDATLVAAGLAPNVDAETLLAAALAAAGLDCCPRPAGDALLSGARAVLDAEAGAIWLRADLPDPVRRLVLAHEIAHFHLHHDEAGEENKNGSRDVTDDWGDPDDSDDPQFASIAAALAVGYGPRERREAEANYFAREFLLPAPLARAWFFEDGLSAADIAGRTGLSLSVVFAQLTEAMGLPAPTLVPAGALTPFPFFASERGAPATNLGAASHEAVIGPVTGTPRSLAKKGKGVRADGGMRADPAPLDPTQQAAARALHGPLLVGAGPGTGKTRTLVARVLFLTGEQNERPDALLLLTFSRRAAEEMRVRIAAEAPDVARRAFIGTFHGYGLDLLRRHWQAAGLPPRPVLLDGRADGVALLEPHLAGLDLRALRYLHDPAFPLPDVLDAIIRAKDELVGPNEYAARAQTLGDERLIEVARLYALYERLLRERGALDFADLVARPVRLLEENAALRQAEQARWRHVLVDEYQDVNPAGARLVRLLTSRDGDAGAIGGRGLWAVGDLRQAIYGWRGASVSSVAGGWERDYPGGARRELGVNYRSRAGLVRAFGVVCGEGENAWQAARRADTPTTLTLGVASDDAAQADGIARHMRAFTDAGYGWGDQAVLCRTRAQAAALRADLAARGVPVAGATQSGGREGANENGSGGLFACPDVKNLLVLLARFVEPDGPAAHRIRDLPASGSGVAWSGSAWQFFASALFGPFGQARRVQNRAAVRALLWVAQGFDERAGALLGRSDSRDAAAAESGRAFLRHVRRLARHGDSSALLSQEADSGAPGDNPGAVRVLTVHAAKGLEFPVVFVPNLSAGKFPARGRPALLPSLPGVNEPPEPATDDGVEAEEARLFFVALTRARDHLVLSRAERPGSRAAKPSPLLARLESDAGDLLRREIWDGPSSKNCDATAEQAKPQLPEHEAAATAPLLSDANEPFTLDAWEAALYLRCPRRYLYERVLALPPGEAAPYPAFKSAVRETLRTLARQSETTAADALAFCWTRLGPDPAHPHAPLYRAAAQEIVDRVIQMAHDSGASETAPLPGGARRTVTVRLAHGHLRVEVDQAAPGSDGAAGSWECHTFRKPPREGRITPDERHTLIREALLQERESSSLPAETLSPPAGQAKRKKATPDPKGGAALHLRYLQKPGEAPVPVPDGTSALRERHLAAYDGALRGIRLQMFAARPREENECPGCPYFFICPA